MGTDVYLDWKGKSKEDKEKQCTGFSIDAGEVGYLRASIGMTTENAFLRGLFPNKRNILLHGWWENWFQALGERPSQGVQDADWDAPGWSQGWGNLFSLTSLIFSILLCKRSRFLDIFFCYDLYFPTMVEWANGDKDAQ
jgi:hypothetical protein